MSVRPLVTNFPEGEMFTDISSVTAALGVSWGDCKLCVSPVDLSNIAGDGYFGNIDLTNHDAILDQFNGFAPSIRRSYYVEPCQIINRSVYGLSLGAATSGIGNLIGRGLRGIIRNIGDDLQSYILDLETGFSSNGNLLRGLNRYDTKYLGSENLSNINICVLRGSIQAILGYSCNLFIIGNFPSMSSIVSSFPSPTELIREEFLTSVQTFLNVGNPALYTTRRIANILDANLSAVIAYAGFFRNLENYFSGVANNAMAWGIINDASFGVLLPGGEFQIIAS